MPYINKNLMPNETIIKQAKVHWIVYTLGTILTLTSFNMFNPPETAAFGAVFLLVGLACLVDAYITRISTELAVTNKRVIAKTGFIARKTIELNLSKVESLNVDQGVLGRIFNFGQITVNGTGGVKTPFKFISKPLDFRKAVNQEIENSEERNNALAA